MNREDGYKIPTDREDEAKLRRMKVSELQNHIMGLVLNLNKQERGSQEYEATINQLARASTFRQEKVRLHAAALVAAAIRDAVKRLAQLATTEDALVIDYFRDLILPTLQLTYSNVCLDANEDETSLDEIWVAARQRSQ